MCEKIEGLEAKLESNHGQAGILKNKVNRLREEYSAEGATRNTKRDAIHKITSPSGEVIKVPVDKDGYIAEADLRERINFRCILERRLQKWTKFYFSGRLCKCKNRMDDRVVIITGASGGVGFQTALELAKRGAHVIMACKQLKDGEKAAKKIIKQSNNDQIEVEYLNLADLESVRSFAKEMNRRLTRLDVLINNAGLMACPRWKTAQGYEMQFGVNHLGHFLLTNLLVDLLKKTNGSRVVTVASVIHMFGSINWSDVNYESKFSPISSYCQSKLANILFTRELAKRLEGTGVTAVCLHPGAVRTKITRHVDATLFPHFSHIVNLVYLGYMVLTKSLYEGAQTSLHCAISDDVPKYNGYYFSDCRPKKPSKQARSNEDAKRLWELSAKMVDIPLC